MNSLLRFPTLSQSLKAIAKRESVLKDYSFTIDLLASACVFTGLLLLSLISGCSALSHEAKLNAITMSSKVKFDERLLEDCPALPKLEGAADTQIIDHSTEVSRLYAECAINKNKLNKEVRKAINVQ